MILGTLTLTNFSAFGGTQSIDLMPKDSQHPIILIGGLNGAGKTSLLTAVRLALFGKRLVQVDKSISNYTQLLRELAYENAVEETAVSLSFDTYTLGEKDQYVVRRSWTVTSSGKVVEDFRVVKNGKVDSVLASTWEDFIDSLIPVNIAGLFFFDGETVADQANEEGAQQLLRTGVQSLLGIDLLSRLREDLADLIHKKAKNHNESEDFSKLNALEEDLQNLKKEQAELEKQEKKLVAQLDALRTQLEAAEGKLRENGADLFLQRTELEAELAEAKAKKHELNAGLIHLAEGVLPFSLVPDLLNAVRKQDSNEQEAFQAATVLDVLEKRDQAALQALDHASPEVRDLLQNFFVQDRQARRDKAKADAYLHLSDEARESLANIDALIAAEHEEAARLSALLQSTEDVVDSLERKLGMVPPQEVVADAINARDTLRNKIGAVETKKSALSAKWTQLAATIDYRSAERERVLKAISGSQADASIDDRIIRYSQLARERVEAFSQRVLLQSISHLEELVLRSITLLFRKEGFIGRASIDATDFTLRLYDCSGRFLPLGRLSAGERQLVIIAILWGLGQASGRPLPIIVDTPLGRLDSIHRVNLLERYFPDVSHQVVLLSTDTEITNDTKERITPFVSSSYKLAHDTKRRLTTISSGYFGVSA